MAESLPSGVDDREDLLDVVAEQVAGEHAFAGVHPVDVAAQGVDLAVVGEVAVGMGAFPAREGVGAEARMHQRQRRGRSWDRSGRGNIRSTCGGVEHALVDQRPAGQAAARRTSAACGIVDRCSGRFSATLADDVELALEGQRIVRSRRQAIACR